jgi:hypothetical protein
MVPLPECYRIFQNLGMKLGMDAVTWHALKRFLKKRFKLMDSGSKSHLAITQNSLELGASNNIVIDSSIKNLLLQRIQLEIFSSSNSANYAGKLLTGHTATGFKATTSAHIIPQEDAPYSPGA